MASQFQKKRGRRSKKFPRNSEINITPMVDVMLVLLIVFMVTAPLLSSGVSVDLAKTKAQEVSTPEKPITISIQKSGKLFLGDKQLTEAQLYAKLAKMSKLNPNSKVFVRGGKDVPYGRVLEIMGQISYAGYKRVALISEKKQN